VFIELKKFHKDADKLENSIDYWLYYLSQWEKPPNHQRILKIFKHLEHMKK
jgi:hypothetical protein